MWTVVAAIGAAPARAHDTAAYDISVLSYNVHGLFRLAAKDSPRDRMPTIGWLANRYDVVLLQEDFEFPDIIRRQMQRHESQRGNGLAGHPGLLAAKILAFPFTFLIPRFSPPYGSGLTSYLPRGADVEEAVARHAYDHCAGWFGSHGDCWARKGYMMVRLRAPNGAEVDFYNTHIEAGYNSRSRRSRQRNFESLAHGVEKYSNGRAVVIGGDFNVDYSFPSDRDLIGQLRAQLGLSDSGAGPQLGVWRHRDFLLFRSGNSARISVQNAGEAHEFVSGARALSDHPALYARFELQPATTEP
jgi:endonuclease/exonuclease/phosphatase family metal-dependent hydrolase